VSADVPELVKRAVFVTGDVLAAGSESFLHHVTASALAKPFTIDEAGRPSYRKLQEVCT
jgi:hypothetical protein